MCVYAPTAGAPPRVKSEFACNLQDTLDKVPQKDYLLLLGDFNTRVGTLRSDEEQWKGITGKHGLDDSR